MSLTERLGALMQRPNEDPVPRDDVPWWMKYAGRGLGTVGGGLAIFLGMWNVIGIIFANFDSFGSGIWQMVAGFLVLVVEAPCCCMFIEKVQIWSEWADKRPYWNRATAYFGLAIPPILICPGLATLLGSGSIFGTGAIYGMMALGRKASADEMKQNVSNLVDNAYPMAKTLPPKVPPV